MKTSELKGAALDFAVEVAKNPELEWGVSIGLHWASNTIVIPAINEPDCYRHPSSNWTQGGPIIGAIPGFEMKAWLESSSETKYEAHIHNYDGDWIEFGSTMLEAAMRCYVASKLGDDVDIPEELAE